MSHDEEKTIFANVSHLIKEDAIRKSRGVACLVQHNGDAIGKRILMNTQLTRIGRAEGNEILITDHSVSRNHAEIEQRSNGVYIRDNNSSNGTYVNNERLIAELKLKDQDTIRFGAILFKYFSAENLDGLIHDKIYRLATIDPGTQIYNKQYLFDSLNAEFTKAKRNNKDLSLIYFDLDFFKKVNDTFGHNAGDQVLAENAALIKQHIRKDDIQCRFGGEEFIIVLPNTKLADAVILAEKIRKACEAKPHLLKIEQNGQTTTVEHCQTISLGVVALTPEMQDPKQMLELADQKLYLSKKTGRNRVSV